MIEAPQILQSEPKLIACLPLAVSRAEIMTVMGPSIQEVFAAIKAQGLAPAGPWFTHHTRRPTDTFDFRICVPLATPITPAGRVVPGELPSAIVARTIYHGPYEGLGGGWGELMAWIEANGHTRRNDLWECYLVGPESSPDPANWRTELNQPLEV